VRARAYDAVVVGSGAAGGWAAKELCEGGLEVLLLEAGPAIDPIRDFPLPAPAERRLASRLAGLARGQHVQLRCGGYNARTRRFFVNDRRHRYTTPRGSAFNWFRGRQVGGRLHVWARVMLRLSPQDFAGWPLDYEELAPSYDAVEEYMGVRRTELTAAEERFRAHNEGAVAAPLAASEPQRVPRTIRAAADTGRLTLHPDAVVRRVSLDQSGRATGVEFCDRLTRDVREARARVVVLCASTIETLRILLNSEIPNASGRLGRFLMDHVMTGVSGPLDPAEDLLPATDPYDLGAGTGFVIPQSGFGVQGGIGRDADSWYMLAHGPMTARAGNRVALDPRTLDRWGVPGAHVACVHAAEEDALASEQLTALRELAAGAGLRVRASPSRRPLDRLAFRLARGRILLPTGAFLPGSAAHEIGGAGMGDDPRASVTDRWGRLWDTENVIVADGACFPAGCWQNVTLTIMALARRAARRVAAEGV